MLTEIIYNSYAVMPMKTVDLNEILTEARRFNKENNITGMLLYREGTFLQVLEGEDRVVNELYTHIQRDARHYGVNTMIDRPIAARNFEGWSMGFTDLDNYFCDLESGEVEQHFSFPDEETLEEAFKSIKPSAALSLIAHFAAEAVAV